MRSRSPIRKRGRGERGVVLVLAGVGLVVGLAFVGLFVDLGLAYVAKARLAKAVDAGSLAAARNVASGLTAMQDIAVKVANANYKPTGSTYSITIDNPSTDTTRVQMTATNEIPTMLLRLMGDKTITMRALGEATRYPLDLSLVLDVSLSLQFSGSFGDLQAASKQFVTRFDDKTDQMGLVTFSVAAKNVTPMQKNFGSTIATAIDGLTPISFTNLEEGVRFGKVQLDTAPARPKAVKVIVLFTDGLPTAVRDTFDVKSPPAKYDGVVVTDSNGTMPYGLFEPVGGQRVVSFNSSGNPVLGSLWGVSQDMPLRLPGNLSVTGPNILQLATSELLDAANTARAAGYRIYCVGLGNLDSSDPADQPDLNLLRKIANENGISNPNQPRGIMLFAPSSSALSNAFTQLADRILTRLTR